MVGNDVVDLGDPEVQPGAQHPRFDARVFARCERAALGGSGAPHRLRWILWAAKEAAYKVARKLDPKIVFSPARFRVRLDANLHGEVEVEGGAIAVKVDEDRLRLHAVAHTEAAVLASVRHQVAFLPSGLADASAAVRALATLGVADWLEARPEDLTIRRVGRVPILLHRGRPAPVDLSLSHHGRFVAFACAVPGRPMGGPS
jgi:phosphopantetheinyl transferase (holo-ACP synthase)